MLYNETVVNRHCPGYNPYIFGYEECRPGWAFGPAVRPYWLLHYVISGKGIFERDGRRYTIRKGEIFVIPPFVETYYEADAEDPWYYTWVGFQADESLTAVLEHPVIRCPGAGHIFEDMRRCREMENGRSSFLCSRIWELCALLQEADTGVPGHIEKALSVMHAEYTTGINVTVIAARLGLDRSYFSTLFKKETGVSPIAYLTELRLKKAAELIADYGESPTTAAISVGYPDYCHFSKAFKKRFGCSPRQYK